MQGKRALSPETSLGTAESVVKRVRRGVSPGAEEVHVGMEQDCYMALDDLAHPLAPPLYRMFGDAGRDGNETLADALVLDASTYFVPPSSPENAVSEMDADSLPPLDQTHPPWPNYNVGSHYGAHLLSNLPQSHPLRAQLSMDTLSTNSSAGPATPAEESFDYDEECPCYVWGKDSAGVPRPFSALVGHGHA